MRSRRRLATGALGWRTVGPCLAAVMALSACGDGGRPGGSDPTSTFQGLDHGAIADLLIERIDLQEGERVLLVGQSGRWDPLVPLLRDGLRQGGAVDLGAVDVFGDVLPSSEATPFASALAAAPPDGLVALLTEVDLAVLLPGAQPTEAAHDVYGALQDVLRGGTGRTVHFHWAGATSFSMDELAVDDRVDELYQQALLETDYEALAETLRSFEAAIRENRIRVTTPLGSDLSFEVGDRPVTLQDGDASAARAARGRTLIDREVELPAGAARVSPVLPSVSGRIVFPPAEWGGVRVEGLTLDFDAGRVTSVDARVGLEGVLAELDGAGDAGRWFRELAVGFNPLLAVPEGGDWIPYYGYGAGVVRLSLGDNTELGGTIGGGYVRWNFFTDATVRVGADVWVEGGRLVRPTGS